MGANPEWAIEVVRTPHKAVKKIYYYGILVGVGPATSHNQTLIKAFKLKVK